MVARNIEMYQRPFGHVRYLMAAPAHDSNVRGLAVNHTPIFDGS